MINFNRQRLAAKRVFGQSSGTTQPPSGTKVGTYRPRRSGGGYRGLSGRNIAREIRSRTGINPSTGVSYGSRPRRRRRGFGNRIKSFFGL